MDTRYVKLLFVLLLFLTLLNLPFPKESPNIVSTDSVQSFFENNESKNINKEELTTYPKGTFIFDMPTLSRQEKNTFARQFHNEYTKVVKAMLELRRQGGITGEEMLAVHRHLSDFAVDSTLEIPHGDKDLVDYLYDNNLINESQYKKLLDIMED